MELVISLCSKLIEDYKSHKYADISIASNEMDINGLSITSLTIEEKCITVETEYATYHIWLDKIHRCWREVFPEGTMAYTFICEGDYEIGLDIY